MANSVAAGGFLMSSFCNFSSRTGHDILVVAPTSCRVPAGKNGSSEGARFLSSKGGRRRGRSFTFEKFPGLSTRKGLLVARLDQNFPAGDLIHSNALDRALRSHVSQGLSPGSPQEKKLQGTQVVKDILNLVTLCLASGFLAVGLSLGFCKPAVAKAAEKPSSVTATLDDKVEVQSRDKELEISEEESKGSGEEDEAEDDPYEPVFGEGSDLTTDATEVILRGYLERHPDDLKALEALLYLRLKKGEVIAAMPILDKLIELKPDDLEWKYLKAQALEFSGELEKAREAFQDILASRPLSARALQGLAVVMQKMGEAEQAFDLLAQALKQASDAGQSKEVLNLRMLLGQMHTIQGNLDAAMEQYRTVVEEDPQDYRPHLCQGLIYSIIGEDAEAEKHFQTYRKLCPKDYPHRGFIDDLMLSAKIESRKVNERQKKAEEYKKKGRRVPKPMQPPMAVGKSNKVPFPDTTIPRKKF